MKTLRLGMAVICLAMLLPGCESLGGDASAGPNPGGGFYGAPNLNVGRINPYVYRPYINPYNPAILYGP